MYFNRSTSYSDFIMINLLSIFGLFLCVWLSSAQAEEICAGNGKYCVYKDMCLNGKIEKSAVRVLHRLSYSHEKCSKYEVCCSVEPRKPRALLQQYGVICNRPGDHCVPQEACIDGFIDKTAGVILKPFMKQDRCGVNEVCCQDSKQKNICTGADKHCVPAKTCINGTIDTSGGGILNPMSNGPVECFENEVCCSYPVQPKQEVDCSGVGKVCVAENLCVNGIIDKGGRNVLIRRMSGPGKCTESQVCCSLPARKPKNKMCTGRKTCVLKHLCVKGTVNTSGIDVINIRPSNQQICSEEQVCCSLPVLKPKKETCTDNGKTCVLKHLCVNGTVNTRGIGVINERTTEQNMCFEDQVCCTLPVRKPKQEMCYDNGKTCVLKHLCVNGTINTSGIDIISVRTSEQNICTEDQVCCAFPAQRYTSPVADPAQECGEGNPEGLETKSENAIAGQAKLGEFPWMVQILERIISEDSFEEDIQCVGSLIAANKVVTAAHCIVNLTESELYVRAGEWNPNALTEPYPHTDRLVKKRIIHEEFDYGHPHSDIAILTLEANFLLSKHINTICLPQPDRNFDNSRCIVAGWGKRSRSDPEIWTTLKKLEVPVVNSVTCQRQLQVPFSRHFKLHSNFICAGGESQSTCDGDGGAPLMCPIAGSNRYELAGVLSYGFECNVKDVPDLYVNVPAKQAWILEHMND